MAALLTDCTDESCPSFGACPPIAGILLERREAHIRRALRPASTTTHDGSWPRGPWLVGVPGPCAQKPKYQSDEWMMSHPEKQTARTQVAHPLAEHERSIRYTLPTNRDERHDGHARALEQRAALDVEPETRVDFLREHQAPRPRGARSRPLGSRARRPVAPVVPLPPLGAAAGDADGELTALTASGLMQMLSSNGTFSELM